jgi:hypothetical protein
LIRLSRQKKILNLAGKVHWDRDFAPMEGFLGLQTA